MFKHLLLPTDGTEMSAMAIAKGVELAKYFNAKVTGFYAAPEFHILTYRAEMLEDTEAEYEKDCKAHAQKYLGVVKAAAKAAGVDCDIVYTTSDHAYDAIIKAAEERGCDLIMMGKHTRKGLEGLFAGSETEKVLAHTHIPVLVFH